MTDRRRNLCCFVACAVAQLLAFVCPLSNEPHFAARLDGDLKLYHAASGAIVSGQLPYRDFPLEYPPGALLAFLGPRLLGGTGMSRASYAIAFAVQNAAMSIACMLLAARLAAKLVNDAGPSWRAAAILYTLLAILGWALIPYRFDLFPTLLTLSAISLATSGGHAASGVLLGLGILAKLYPLVLAPLLLAHAARKHAATRFSIACAVTVAACILPFLATAGTKTLSFLTYHKERGIQIESLTGGALCLAQVAGIAPVVVSYDHGALHLRSPIAGRVLRVQELATPVLLLGSAAAWSWWLSKQRDDANRALLTASTAMLLTFVIANKVLSPQFLIWLLPSVAILRGRTARTFLLAWALTLLVYPFMYAALRDLSPMVVGLVNLRNAAILTLLGILISGHVRRPKPIQRMTTFNWQATPAAVTLPGFPANPPQREGL
jgi:uncharacterized membrane protein